MAAHINIHDAHEISAYAGGTSGAPITIRAHRAGAILGDEITLFTDDHGLSRKLAGAINATVRDHKAAGRAEAEAALVVGQIEVPS